VDKSAVSTAYAGQTVTYSYTVTNVGNDPLSTVSVDDDPCGPATYTGGDTNGNAILEEQETWTYTCSQVLTETTTNVATATAYGSGGSPVTATDSHTVTIIPINPAITLSKQADSSRVVTGDTVTYSYQVANTGDVPLTQVRVDDVPCGQATYVSGDTNGNSQLDITETWAFSCSQVLTTDTTNTATATGTHPGGGTVTSNTATATVDVIHPSMNLVKSASATEIQPGDWVTYYYQLTNTGDDLLSSPRVNDNRCGVANYAYGDTNLNGDLDTNETWHFSCSMQLFATTTNTAVATATDTLGNTVTATDTLTVRLSSTTIYLPAVFNRW
jgi:uncharacterized repeat protein (TIGR01451 family)